MQMDAKTLEIETAVYIANSVNTLGIGESCTSSTNPNIPQPSPGVLTMVTRNQQLPCPQQPPVARSHH